MLYQYLSIYASVKADLALLTINLLSKDCRDQDPHVRGLALRTLCSLRVANLVEYLVCLLLNARSLYRSDLLSLLLLSCHGSHLIIAFSASGMSFT